MSTSLAVSRVEHLDRAELDRVIGVLYELVETWFQTAVHLAFRR